MIRCILAIAAAGVLLAAPAPRCAAAEAATSPTLAVEEWILPESMTPADVHPDRIIAATRAVTETILALGEGERLVAVDEAGSQVPEAAELPVVGYHATLSAEGILALNPTLLLAGERLGPETTVRQLREALLPMLVVRGGDSAEAALARIERIAALLGREEKGRELTGAIRRELHEAAALAGQSGRRPRVLLLMSHAGNQVMAAGAGTSADALIALAGGENVCADFEGYRPLTPESAVLARPDWIVVAAGGDPEETRASLQRNQALALTPAVREGHVLARPIGSLLSFGPHLGEIVLDLARQWHGAPQQATAGTQ